MKQNTTKTDSAHRWMTWPVWAGASLAVLLLVGRASARQRDQPTNLVGNLRYRSAGIFGKLLR
jgi:hypothetical protein